MTKNQRFFLLMRAVKRAKRSHKPVKTLYRVYFRARAALMDTKGRLQVQQ